MAQNRSSLCTFRSDAILFHSISNLLSSAFIRGDSLVEPLLHRPVNVNVRREVFKDARDLCFTNGVVFVAERGSSAIRFIELKGEVLFKPGRLKSRADLLSQLSRFRLSLEGTGPVLQKRLTTHLRSLAAQVEN